MNPLFKLQPLAYYLKLIKVYDPYIKQKQNFGAMYVSREIYDIMVSEENKNNNGHDYINLNVPYGVFDTYQITIFFYKMNTGYKVMGCAGNFGYGLTYYKDIGIRERRRVNRRVLSYINSRCQNFIKLKNL